MRSIAELYARRTDGIAPWLDESLALFRARGDRFGETRPRRCSSPATSPPRAPPTPRRSRGSPAAAAPATALAAIGFAGVMVADGDATGACRLLAAADAAVTAARSTVTPLVRHVYDRNLAAIRASLGHEILQATWDAGARLPLDDALREALA